MGTPNVNSMILLNKRKMQKILSKRKESCVEYQMTRKRYGYLSFSLGHSPHYAHIHDITIIIHISIILSSQGSTYLYISIYLCIYIYRCIYNVFGLSIPLMI